MAIKSNIKEMKYRRTKHTLMLRKRTTADDDYIKGVRLGLARHNDAAYVYYRIGLHTRDDGKKLSCVWQTAIRHDCKKYLRQTTRATRHHKKNKTTKSRSANTTTMTMATTHVVCVLISAKGLWRRRRGGNQCLHRLATLALSGPNRYTYYKKIKINK